MTRFSRAALVLLAALLGLTLYAAPALALFKTFISSSGNDANSCDIATPCATMGRAISQTNNGGMVSCLDSKDYTQSVTITASMTIDCSGTTAGAGPFTINAAGITVVIKNVFIFVNTIPGITFVQGAALIVKNCHITNNPQGIFFAPSGDSQLFVSDTIVRDNVTDQAVGILIRPTGTGTASVALERVQVLNNGQGGIVATAGGSGGVGTVVNIAVRDSVASGNGATGILAGSQVGGPNVIMTLDHVAATSNGIGIEADGSDMDVGGIALSNTQVSGNGTGLMSVNGGVLVSFQNNFVIGNGTDGTPTNSRAPQ